MSEQTNDNFLGLDVAHSDFDRAGVLVLPIPYEETVSYGGGTAHGPAAIITASQQVELYDREFDCEPALRYGVHTLPPVALPGVDPAGAVEGHEQVAACMLGHARTVIGKIDHDRIALAVGLDSDGVSAAGAFQHLHRVPRQIGEHAIELVGIGVDDEILSDRDPPVDRPRSRQAEAFADLLDERPQRDVPPLERRLARPSIAQRLGAQPDRPVERLDELRRHALHGRVGHRAEAIGDELGVRQHVAQVVIDLGDGEAERRQMALLAEHGDELELHLRQFLLGDADLVVAT